MPADELPLLRAAQDRALEQEGIPMVLALVSETGPVPAATDADVRAEGARLADRMDHLRAALIPGMREDDNGALISLVQAMSYEDFGSQAGE